MRITLSAADVGGAISHELYKLHTPLFSTNLEAVEPPPLNTGGSMRLLTLTIFMILSLNAFAQSSEQLRDRRAIDSLSKSAQLLAKTDLRCTDKSDCAVIPMGSRACGGPNGYLVTSKDNSNLQEIEDLARTVTDKERSYNRRYRIFSICSLVTPPTAVCIRRKCSAK